jgi:hypothetical protein
MASPWIRWISRIATGIAVVTALGHNRTKTVEVLTHGKQRAMARVR